jgi:Phage capsid family
MRPLVPEDLYRNGAARQREAATALMRAVLCRSLAVINKQLDPAKHVAARYPTDRLAQFLTRASSAPATTTGTGWAAELAQSVVADYLAGLGPVSAAAEIFGQALNLTFDRAARVTLPHFVAEYGNAGFVAEGAPIPVRQFATDNPDPLTPHKLAAIAVLTRELVESSNAERLIADVLTRAVGRMLDEVLFDANPASTIRPAGLRQGVSALTASSATDPGHAFTDDMGALGDAVSPVAANSGLIYVASPGRALKMKLRLTRDIDGLMIVGSNAVQNDLLCIVPAGLAVIAGTTPEIETSREASAVMNTAPVDIGAGGAPVGSVFQTDNVSLKLRFPVTWSRRDPRGFAWTTPTGW